MLQHSLTFVSPAVPDSPPHYTVYLAARADFQPLHLLVQARNGHTRWLPPAREFVAMDWTTDRFAFTDRDLGLFRYEDREATVVYRSASEEVD